NTVNASTLARINGSTINSAGRVLGTADSTISVEAVTIAAAITAGSGHSCQTPEKGTSTVSGAGAGSGNSITKTVEASITHATTTGSFGILAAKGVEVRATDTSTITADAGGFAIALILSTSGKFVSVAIGLAAAQNTITNSVDAFITGSTVDASGKLAAP